MTTVQVLHAGWLTKRGGVRKSWKRRFFVLLSNEELRYYNNEAQTEKLGTVNLKDAEAVEYCTDFTEYPYCLKVIVPGRDYFMAAPTLDDLNKWKRSITDVTFASSKAIVVSETNKSAPDSETDTNQSREPSDFLLPDTSGSLLTPTQQTRPTSQTIPHNRKIVKIVKKKKRHRTTVASRPTREMSKDHPIGNYITSQRDPSIGTKPDFETSSANSSTANSSSPDAEVPPPPPPLDISSDDEENPDHSREEEKTDQAHNLEPRSHSASLPYVQVDQQLDEVHRNTLSKMPPHVQPDDPEDAPKLLRKDPSLYGKMMLDQGVKWKDTIRAVSKGKDRKKQQQEDVERKRRLKTPVSYNSQEIKQMLEMIYEQLQNEYNSNRGLSAQDILNICRETIDVACDTLEE